MYPHDPQRPRLLAGLQRLIFALLLLPATAAAQDDVLLIINPADPVPADLTYINILDGLELTYEIAAHTAFTVEQAASKRLVLISESVSSGNIGSQFNDLQVPVVTMEGFVQDDMGFTGATENEHYGFVATAGEAINVVGDHPVLGGLPTGLVGIYQTAGSMQWGIPVEAAIILATLPDDDTRAVFYLLEEGAELLNGLVAPARRVFFTPHSSISQSMTEQGTLLIANAILWALGSEEFLQIGASTTAAFTATPSSGFAPLTVEFDASASSSPADIVEYAWQFHDGSTANGVTTSFTYNDPGTFEVVLTITDSMGGTASLTRAIAVGAPVSMDPHFTIPWAASAPNIDGERDDVWDDAVVLDIANVVNGVAPVDEDDLSATVSVLYDGDHLYAFYTVRDADLFNDSPNSWEDDAVDLYIDGQFEKCFNCYDDNDAQYELSYMSDEITGNASAALREGVTYAWADIDGGYTIEVRVPWANFGVSPVEGTLIGIEFMVNDDDVGENNRETKLAWFSNEDNTYQYAHLMGNAELGPASVARERGDMPVSFGIAGAYPNPFNPTTTAILSIPDPGDYELAVYDLTGRRVRVEQLTPAMSGQVSVSIEFADLASGVYFVALRQLATGRIATLPVTLIR